MQNDTNSAQILIVDDDQALLQALQQTLYLRIKGIKVDTCDSAQPALEHIHKIDYDAIISDIKMPGMDGLELLEKVHELRPETPVLLITGHADHDLAIRAIRGRAYDYIPKPIERDSFVAALQRAIQAYQLRRLVIEQHIALKQHANILEQMVQTRTQELITANATKDKFIGIVSHELTPPLTNLQAIAQSLRRQLDHPDTIDTVKQGLTDMEHSLHRTQMLVQDLLDTSHMQNNMFVLHRKRCNLVDLCHSLLNEYTSGAGPVLTSECIDQPIEAEIDENRIGEVLINLLSNARKYSSRETPITITLHQSGYEAILTMHDQGIGIPSDSLPHIFEQFYRVPGVATQNGERDGQGLGLYITHKIVERHGGHITVQSAPGAGSTFTVALPLYIGPQERVIETPPSDLRPRTQALWTLATC